MRKCGNAEMRIPNVCVMFESFCIHLLHHGAEKSTFDRKPQFKKFLFFSFHSFQFSHLHSDELLFRQNEKGKHCERFNLQCKVWYISTALTPFSFESRRIIVLFIFRNWAHTETTNTSVSLVTYFQHFGLWYLFFVCADGGFFFLSTFAGRKQ